MENVTEIEDDHVEDRVGTDKNDRKMEIYPISLLDKV